MGVIPDRDATDAKRRERRIIMAGGVNKVILVGHLGADPDMRYTPSGQGVCELRLATSESWNDKNGQRQERTEWHRIVVWGKRAEVCSKYLAKGRQVFVEGRIQTRTYDDKDGNKRYITEIIANDVQFLGGGREGAGAGAGAGAGRGGRDEGPPPPSDGDFGGGGGGFGGGGGGGFGGGGGGSGGGGGGPDDDIPF
jgi:single-strand DNA-binding protein